jgi:hypothetical protein
VNITEIVTERLPATNDLMPLEQCGEIHLHFGLDNLNPSKCAGG